MIVYKVVRRTPKGKLISAISSIIKVNYLTTRSTVPKVGKLFVFSEYMQALEFVYNRVNDWPETYPFEIWSAETDNAVQPYAIMLITTDTTKNNIKYFWEYECFYSEKSGIIDGTLVCDSLMLKEKLYEDREYKRNA